jgi:hypothetical protein
MRARRIAGLSLFICAAGYVNAADSSGFGVVRGILENTCSACHNAQVASGGLNLLPLAKSASVAENRETWQRVVQKLRSGEMPPKGIPRPEGIDAAIRYLQGEFDRADRRAPVDPGRVTARRLNRNEYSNTIRDLLGVEFHAEKSFPTDDLGDGFDNIADVLTVSPVLMEKYLAAAQRIAARAIGADPLPKPFTVEYAAKEHKIRRPDLSTIEATHRVDFDGEYTVRFGLPGERAPDGKPVTLGFWMDGKLLASKPVPTKPSGLVYFDPYSEEEMRLFLPEGDHVFRAGFIDDPFVKDLTAHDAYNRKKNKFLDSITFIGPYPSSVEKPCRKKILLCDPNSGAACVQRIVATLARRAYRRPVTAKEVSALMKFVAMAKADGQSTEQGIELALEAMLVSPNFLFRLERDPPGSAGPHPVSEVELASRLSYFLWSSMPDDELLSLAEAGKLRTPGALDAQIRRMLADERSSVLGQNFAGQWLELRNLDVVKPDPQKFPEWGPELRDAMKTETQMFFDYVLRQNRPLADFLDAKYTFLNERLARFYGITGVQGPEFRRVDLSTDERGGVLTQAGVLTVSSYPTRTSVVIRGKYILQNILGDPPPPPPPDVPPLDEAAVGTSASLRQQMEQHRANPACASCHNKMDPLGFGLENYNGIGKWRTMDGKFPVDASGTLPDGKTFSTPAEMRTVLRSRLPEFAHLMVEKMMTYALGRGITSADRPAVNDIARIWARKNYPFKDLIYFVAHTAAFQSRRPETATSRNAAKPKEVARR